MKNYALIINGENILINKDNTNYQKNIIKSNKEIFNFKKNKNVRKGFNNYVI